MFFEGIERRRFKRCITGPARYVRN